MSEYEISKERVEEVLRGILNKYGIVQNLNIRPIGNQLEVRIQLRPFNPDSSSEMAIYQAGQQEEREQPEKKKGLFGLREGLKKRFLGKHEKT